MWFLQKPSTLVKIWKAINAFKILNQCYVYKGYLNIEFFKEWIIIKNNQLHCGS